MGEKNPLMTREGSYGLLVIGTGAGAREKRGGCLGRRGKREDVAGAATPPSGVQHGGSKTEEAAGQATVCFSPNSGGLGGLESQTSIHRSPVSTFPSLLPPSLPPGP